jgi:heat shock protein HtpX
VGLLQTLDHNQVAAVLGHEVGHIKNRDTLTMTVAAACASMISLIAHLGFWFGLGSGDRDRNPLTELLIFIFAPISATLIQLAISRTREFAADRESAKLMGSPQYMISALQRLEDTVPQIPSTTAQTSTAHMYIASPFRGGGLMSLFATHPSMEERIKRLKETA